MKPTGSLRLAADLRDLQIVDADGFNCGIVDDIELDGRPGGRLTIAALSGRARRLSRPAPGMGGRAGDLARGQAHRSRPVERGRRHHQRRQAQPRRRRARSRPRGAARRAAADEIWRPPSASLTSMAPACADRGGARLGRLRELYCRDGEVTHIGVGLRTLAERLTGQGGRRIPWSRVAAIRGGEIIVEDADGSAPE